MQVIKKLVVHLLQIFFNGWDVYFLESGIEKVFCSNKSYTKIIMPFFSYLTPNGGLRYLLSIAASREMRRSLARSTGFSVFSARSAGIHDGRK